MGEGSSIRERCVKALANLFLVGAAIIAIFPIFYIAFTAFKPFERATDPSFWIFTPSLENFIFIYTYAIGSYLWNSLVITIGSIILTVPLGLTTAYSLARSEFRGRDDLAFWFLSLNMMSGIAVALPLYIVFLRAQIIGTYLCLMMAQTMMNLPIFIWMVRGFIQEVPEEFEKAAMLDGCSTIQAFMRVLLPIIRPGLIAAIMYCAVLSWNEFLFNMLLSSTATRPLSVGLSTEFHNAAANLWGPLWAATTIYVIPAILVGLVIQKYMAKAIIYRAIR